MEIEDLKNIVHEETYARDDIEYSVFVTEVDGKFWGWWFCKTCVLNPGKPSSLPANSIEKAVTDAITNLGGHHWSCHRKK